MKKKLSKIIQILNKLDKKLSEIHPVWFMLLWIFVLFAGCCIFWIGFHNLDNCQNYERIEQMVNCKYKHELNETFKLVEQSSYGDTVELTKCYMDGIDTVFHGTGVMAFACLLVGVYFEKIRRGV